MTLEIPLCLKTSLQLKRILCLLTAIVLVFLVEYLTNISAFIPMVGQKLNKSAIIDFVHVEKDIFTTAKSTNTDFVHMEENILTTTKSPAKKVEEVVLESLTLHCNEGRLGNQMCTLAVLKGLGALNRRNISMLPCNKKALDPYFELTVPEVNRIAFVERDPYNISFFRRPEDEKISNRTNIIKGYLHPCSYTFFNHIRKDIRNTFRFKEKFRSNAEQTLSRIRGNRTNVTFVGLHVRRGDYVKSSNHAWLWAFKGREVDREYFEKATKYFREKYHNVIFVVVSDDLPWCRKHLKDLDMHILDKSLGRAYDMAILAQCNHTLMTYGTFGFWGGYLAGGDVVYFDNFLKPGTIFAENNFRFEKMYLPEWVGIDTTKPGFWDTYVPPSFSD